MLSNGALGTHSVLKLENLTALEFFLSLVVTVSNYWIIVILLCLTCVRDFCEIFIFTTLKIVERVIWTLEIIGFEKINEDNKKNSRLASSQGVGTQTDLWLHNVTEKPVPTIKFKDATDSLTPKESQTSPFSQSSVHTQDFTSLQHQYYISPQQSNSRKYALNVVEEVEKLHSRPVNDLKASPIKLQHMCQSPVCTIHLTPCSTTKFKDTTDSHMEKESQTSPSWSSVYNLDLSCYISPQQSNSGKYALNVVEEVEKLHSKPVNDLKATPINLQHMCQSPVCTIHLTPCSTIKFKDTTVSHMEKESQTSPSRSSVYSLDSTSSQNQNFTSSQNQDCTSPNQDFTSTQQNNTEKYDLNVVEENEKLATAIITVDDIKACPKNHMSQSPVCTIHLTPCPTNLRAKYSKVLVDSMSPEEFSYLRRKWNSLRKSKKRPYLQMQPICPSYTEDSSDERRPKKARMMNIQHCDNDKESVQEVDSPEMNGCYKNFFLKLKSKFTQHKDTLVSYKNL